MKIKTRKSTKPCSWLSTIGVILILTTQSAICNPDWLQSCSVCHCYWNSGKKTADCKSLRLSTLPTDISSEMQVIDLSNNNIAEIRRDEFLEANLQSLHKLFMRNSTLQEISRDAFNGLDVLIELDMSSNFIRALHSGTFTGPNRLRNIIMNYNEIEVLENYLFDDLPLLSRVEFKFNKLKQIGTYAFGELPKLVAVYLEGNQLSVLHKETFLRKPKLIYLSLAQNPWNCTCDLQEFRDFALTNRLYTAPTSCYNPPNLRGKLWSDVPSDSFACQPRILGSVRSFVEVQSDNVSLPCRIQGSPRPNVTWMYNNRPVNTNDYRIKILNSIEQSHLDSSGASSITSELRIYGVRTNDKGIYTCVANNRGGRAESEFQLLVNGDQFSTLSDISDNTIVGATSDAQSNILLIICLIITTFLLLLVIVVLIICWYCKRLRTYRKDSTASTGAKKVDKTRNSSMLEGSVIMEMQKSLLTDVNPVEKPPRRTDLEGIDGADDSIDIKKTLLDNSKFVNQPQLDDETRSVAMSDITLPHKTKRGFINENYGTNLPPDLLAFPARIADTSPSMQSSHSFIPDQAIYGIRSPSLTSPVYGKMTPHCIYGTTSVGATPTNGFMTLQHPKSRNLSHIAVVNSHQQQQQYSPFVPAPVIYSPAPVSGVIKHGYMTIPRKPRIPSWAPSSTSVAQPLLLSEFQSPISPNPSETGTTITLESQSEPVYDNLGLRTTVGGNSTLNLQKIQHSDPVVRYSMRDRPLPATPSMTSDGFNASAIGTTQQYNAHNLPALSPNVSVSNNTPSKIYEPIQELIDNQQNATISDSQSPYEIEQNYNQSKIASNTALEKNESGSYNELPKLAKIPPRPPPKPKKKMSVSTSRSGIGSKSQLFDDEGEDGTEV